MKKTTLARWFFVFVFTACAYTAQAAQHQHEPQQPPAQAPAPKPSEHDHSQHEQKPAEKPAEHDHSQHGQPPAQQPDHSQHQMPTHQHDHGAMTGSMMTSVHGGPCRSMSAMGSATSLMPCSTPVYGLMVHKGKWMFMLHGQELVRYNRQGGPRGADAFNAQGYFMVMADRKVGPGTFEARGMFSADPFTMRGPDPYLFQMGETYKGRFIIDGQHDHDLFAELAAMYTVPVGKNFAFQVYGGPRAEPALGPSAVMHRPIIGVTRAHHKQDSTHITNGSATFGVTAYWFKVEGSVFHGKEPDERRLNLDFGRFDSWSTRVSFAPGKNWVAQVSHGELHEPEEHAHGNQSRTTASLHYNRAWGEKNNLALGVIWGRTAMPEEGKLHGFTVEAMATVKDKTDYFAQVEWVDNVGLEHRNIFDRPGLPHQHGHGHGLAAQRVGIFNLGAVRDFKTEGKVRLGLGGKVAFFGVPETLRPVYGSQPVSFELFLRIRPGRMQ